MKILTVVGARPQFLVGKLENMKGLKRYWFTQVSILMSL